jgi:hypothetical protein
MRTFVVVSGKLFQQAARRQGDSPVRFPRYLVVKDDCYYYDGLNIGYSPRISRRRTYEIYDQTGAPWKGCGVVTEQITVITGSLTKKCYPPHWNASEGKFVDYISRGSLPVLYELQQFKYLSPPRAYLSSISYIPLISVELNGLHYGTLSIYAAGDHVSINGDGGNVPSCH